MFGLLSLLIFFLMKLDFFSKKSVVATYSNFYLVFFNSILLMLGLNNVVSYILFKKKNM